MLKALQNKNKQTSDKVSNAGVRKSIIVLEWRRRCWRRLVRDWWTCTKPRSYKSRQQATDIEMSEKLPHRQSLLLIRKLNIICVVFYIMYVILCKLPNNKNIQHAACASW